MCLGFDLISSDLSGMLLIVGRDRKYSQDKRLKKKDSIIKCLQYGSMSAIVIRSGILPDWKLALKSSRREEGFEISPDCEVADEK